MHLHTGRCPVKPVCIILRSLSEHKEVILALKLHLLVVCCTAAESKLLFSRSQKTGNLVSVTFTQNKCFTHHLRCNMPQRTGLSASQDMLTPAAAIWRLAACCLHSVTPNPTVPIAPSFLPVSRWEPHTPAAACVGVCMFVFACGCPPRSLLCKHIHSQHFWQA